MLSLLFLSAALGMPTSHSRLSLTEVNQTASELPNGQCVVTKCFPALASCIWDSQCRKAVFCMKRCSPSDVLCSNYCFMEYSNPKFVTLSSCITENHCAEVVISHNKCPFDGNIPNRPLDWSNKEFFLSPNSSDVDGWIRVARGSDPALDCVPCQKLRYKKLSTSSFQGHPDVETLWTTRMNGKLRSAVYTLRQMDPNSLLTKYKLFGMDLEEHYYILDHTDNYIYYFYCGYGFGGEYQGTVLYTKSKSGVQVPVDLQARFDQAVDRAGLREYVPSFSSLCTPDYTCDQQ